MCFYKNGLEGKFTGNPMNSTPTTYSQAFTSYKPADFTDVLIIQFVFYLQILILTYLSQGVTVVSYFNSSITHFKKDSLS